MVAFMLARKLELDPNDAQRTYFHRAAGCHRKAYNWAKATAEDAYECVLAARCVGDSTLKAPSEVDLRRELNAIKAEQFPYMLEVSKQVIQQAVRDFGTAMKNFFAGRARYPKRKRKNRDQDSFYAETVRFNGRKAVLPKIGSVRLKELPPEGWTPGSARIVREADRWYLCVLFKDAPAPVIPETTKAVGVDLGVNTAVVTSDGQFIDSPKPLKRMLGKLAVLQRRVARCHGIFNKTKLKARVAKVHAGISHIRKNFIHQVTTRLVRDNQTIVIEDLNVKGMMKGTCARSVSDIAFGMFRTVLTYKCERYGRSLLLADRWYPSSKTCSGCGEKHPSLLRGDRTFSCPACGLAIDRDLNAARNLLALSSSATRPSDDGKPRVRAARRQMTKAVDSKLGTPQCT